jgi:hypothetical protein
VEGTHGAFNWSEPVTGMPGNDWVPQLLPGWIVVTAWYAPMRKDVWAAQFWQQAVSILDDARPATDEEANRDWRLFVKSIWDLRIGYAQRHRGNGRR